MNYDKAHDLAHAMRCLLYTSAANQVPLLVGETGIGKTSLAARVADVHDWELVTIDGNLLKEGEIGGLPTVETVTHTDGYGHTREVKTTVYAVHHTLEHVAQAVDKGRQVLQMCIRDRPYRYG